MVERTVKLFAFPVEFLAATNRGGRSPAYALIAALLFAATVLLHPGHAAAQIGSHNFDSGRYSCIVIDAATGRVLEADNADEPRYPASLTKMMTVYMLFEALRDRRVTLDELVPVSAHAASMEPSKLGLVPGMRLTVQEALLGLVTKSANDAASALAELLGGSEAEFAQMMTLRARALGMNATTFRNASGLPDPDQVTTARDMAVLARHLVQDFPVEYRYFSIPGFIWHGRVIPNHDHLLTTYPGADGIKTGYTQAAGHNLVTSAVRDGVRLIGVVLGDSSNFKRDIHMADLLDQGFVAMNVPVVPNTVPTVASVRFMPHLIGPAHGATIRFVSQRYETRMSQRYEPRLRYQARLRYQPRMAHEHRALRRLHEKRAAALAARHVVQHAAHDFSHHNRRRVA